MAFFKFRKDGAEPTAPAPAAESLDAMRKRARHRLLGAAALVLVGVVGFPMLFDSQPRPIDVNIAIDIPEKAKVAPLAAAPAVVTPAAEEPTAAKAPVAQPEVALPAASDKAATVAAAQASPEKPVDLPSNKPAVSDKAAAVKAPSLPAAKSETKAPSPAQTNAGADAAKAQTLLEGKDPAATPPGARYTVQVGAFADAQKAHEARVTLEKAGLKTYTQVISNGDGKRTRVRVGPFADKAEADKAAQKIKALNLSAAVLTL
jgi:DedD protein